MYGVKQNRCFEEFNIIRFQETVEVEAGQTKLSGFHSAKITGRNAAISNFVDVFYPSIHFDLIVEEGYIQVMITNSGDEDISLTYNVTVI